MKIVGIVGGVASGKSTVAEIFREHGASVISADEIGHEALRDPEIIQMIAKRWGSDVISSSGEIDRRQLAMTVFSDDGNRDALDFLEQVTHPYIKNRVLTEIDRLQATGAGVVVMDAALLLEAGWDSMCKNIVFIDASAEVREKFAAMRHWTKQELFRRESHQHSLEEKRSAADIVICNNGSLDSLRKEISTAWDSLCGSEMRD
ncbi:MAG: dephospho-CoA kinase [Planctomycetota bacterium]|nr:dephospho-CoA kinase [Planctomycetota bacterium]